MRYSFQSIHQHQAQNRSSDSALDVDNTLKMTKCQEGDTISSTHRHQHTNVRHTDLIN